MAVKKPESFKINLLHRKSEELKIHYRLLRWILSSGRFIVVIVEMVVVVAFVARYKFDADLASLQEKIDEQIPYIESLRNDELLIKQTQFQLSTIRKGFTENPTYSQALLSIAKITPQGIRLSSINIDRTKSFPKVSVVMNGEAASHRDVAAFINALKQNPLFSDISLTNISFEREMLFTITGSYNEQKGTSI